MDKFQNKYRIPSARLQTWDYGSNGSYFITICTQNREHYFGEILEGEMQLNNIGKLAEQNWLAIPQYFSFVELGNFVVMPNHTHGILIIDKNADVDVETRLIASLQTPTGTPSPTGTASPTGTPFPTDPPFPTGTPFPSGRQSPSGTPFPTKKTGGFAGDKNPMFYDNISRIIRWYKGRCSFEFRKIHADFEWQSRFHDHIIRNFAEFERIQNYISNNPLNWKEDKFYV